MPALTIELLGSTSVKLGNGTSEVVRRRPWRYNIHVHLQHISHERRRRRTNDSNLDSPLNAYRIC